MKKKILLCLKELHMSQWVQRGGVQHNEYPAVRQHRRVKQVHTESALKVDND